MDIVSMWSDIVAKCRKKEPDATRRPVQFQKLTPIRNVDLKIYEDALTYVFSDPDIKSVAITGTYGAGKSSIIETYKASHPEHRFMHISLAYFEPEISQSSPQVRESALEGKILNQLIHQINATEIPLTNFKVKKKTSYFRVLMTTSVLVIFILALALLVYFNQWQTYASRLSIGWLHHSLSWTTNNAFPLFDGLICIVILAGTLYSIIKVGRNRNFVKRISLQGNEIEVFEQDKDSTYFDKHLNEVLYLFENAGSDVIVFEDLDRYNAIEIFSRLREINTLVNNRISHTGKPTIRFFYLLRDDVFTSKDRTKFFDFIIPVVPVVDGTNSYDQLVEHFRRGGMSDWFDNDFLQSLSLYVDDMRLLKNIFNEFIMYHDRIKSIEIRPEKLLALITYKNVFPTDFSELQLGRGFVHTLFQSKPVLEKHLIDSLEDEMRTSEEEIRQMEQELLVSQDELDAIYFIPPKPPAYLLVSGKTQADFPTRRDFIHEMRKGQVLINLPNNQRLHYDIQGELNKLNNPEYLQRKRAIEGKSQEQISHQREKIARLEVKKQLIENLRLQDMINKENIDSVFKVNFKNEIGEENRFETIKSSPYFSLIKFLIRNGYIDESYPDYMTYFYENSLRVGDKIFLRSVLDQVPKEPHYSLKDPEMVIARLRIVDFGHEEVLNFDLLHYLLDTEEKNREQLTLLLQQVKNRKNYRFVVGFIETKHEHAKFIRKLNSVWPSIFRDLLEESNFSPRQIKNYAIDTLYYTPRQDVPVIDADGSLSNYISNESSFLDIRDPDIEKLTDRLMLLNVKFTNIDFHASNKEMLKAVYQHDLYTLSFDMILMILENVYLLPKTIDFTHKNFSLIMSKPDDPLALYVNANIKEYLKVGLENCGGLITDEESPALQILNNSNVDLDQKKTYLTYLKTELEIILYVDDLDLWPTLLSRNLVKYIEDNILAYFFENELDSTLVQFINSGNKGVSFDSDSIDKEYGEKSTSKFFNAIVTNDNLENNRYEALLSGFGGRGYSSFQHKGISPEKMTILIRLGVVRMTASNLLFMRENYSEHVTSYIVKNIRTYVEQIVNDENFNLGESLILMNQNIPDGLKIKLLNHTNDAIPVAGKNYSDAVKSHILVNNLDINDIPFLLANYSSENKEVKKIIEQIAIAHADNIWEEGYSLSRDLCSVLINGDGLAQDHKKKLLALGLDGLTLKETIEHLKSLDMKDFIKLFDAKWPKFENNPVNMRMLSTFKEKGWISSVEASGDELRARGRKFGKNKTPVNEKHTLSKKKSIK